MSDNEEQLTIRAMLRNEVSGPLRQLRQELENVEKRINATNANLTSGAEKAERATKRQNDALTNLAKTASAPTWAQVGAQFSGFAGIVDRATNRSVQLAGALTRVGAAGAIGFGALEAYGLKSAAAIEGMKVSLTTMFGNDGGNRLFGQLQDLANFTPFSTQQQIQGAQILGAYGIAQDQLVGLSKAISDVASASSSPEEALHGISLALGQVQAKGHVAGQEIIQLANFQVPALQILASEYGKTTSEIQQMLDTGTKFDAGPFLQYFQQLNGPLAKFQGMSEKQSQTLHGVWSTFTSMQQQGMAEAFAPSSDMIKKFLPDFGKELSQVEQGMGPDVGRITGSLLQMASPLLRVLDAFGRPTLRFAADSLGRLVPSVQRMAMNSPQMADGMERFFNAMEPAIPALGELLIDLPPLVGSFAEMGGSALPGLLIPMLQFADSVLDLVNSSPMLRDAFVGLTVAVWGLNGAFTILKDVNAIVQAIQGVGMAVDLLTGKYVTLTAAETASGEAALASSTGTLGRLGKIAGVGGGAALGGFGVYEGAKSNNTAGSALGLIGGTAAIGAAAGSVVPGLGTGLGALAGGLAGAGAFGVKSLMGDTSTAWGNTLSMSNRADAMTPGSRGITSGVRTFGTSGPGSDHHSGRAIDRAGSFMQSYAANVRKIGGYATVHDAGFGRHVHSAFGDTQPRGSMSMGGSGGWDGPPIQITAHVYGEVDLQKAVADGIEEDRRRRKERS